MNTFHLAVWTLTYLSEHELHHLPDINTVDGLLDLLAACTLVILGNVLDFRTYCAPNQREEDVATPSQRQQMSLHDRNAIPANERAAICYARGIGLAVFQWIRSSCVIKTPEGVEIEDVPSRYFVHILSALVHYKGLAAQRRLGGAPHCDTRLLKLQIENVVKCDPLIKKRWQMMGDVLTSLRFTLDADCAIEWKTDVSVPSKCFTLFHCHFLSFM